MKRWLSIVLTALFFASVPSYAQDDMRSEQLKQIVKSLGLKEVLKDVLNEQDIDTLNVYLKDFIAGRNPVLPEDLRLRLEQAGKKLYARSGPMLDLLLDFAAISAKQALRDAQEMLQE